LYLPLRDRQTQLVTLDVVLAVFQVAVAVGKHADGCEVGATCNIDGRSGACQVRVCGSTNAGNTRHVCASEPSLFACAAPCLYTNHCLCVQYTRAVTVVTSASILFLPRFRCDLAYKTAGYIVRTAQEHDHVYASVVCKYTRRPDKLGSQKYMHTWSHTYLHTFTSLPYRPTQTIIHVPSLSRYIEKTRMPASTSWICEVTAVSKWAYWVGRR